MKKVYTILAAALCLSLSATAQRVIDVSTTLTSPATGTTLTSGVTTVSINAVVKNLDVDTVRTTDSIFYQYVLNGQVLPITIGSQIVYTFFKTGKALKLNDTIQLNRPNMTLSFPASANGTKQLCVLAWAAHRGTDTISDNVMTNNLGCATVTLAGGLGVNEVTGNADENLVTNVYPIPAQNVANIDVALANKSTVTVKIADLIGRNISVENKGSFNKGQHTISVNTSSLPTGVYLYQVIMNDQVSTGKLIIAK